MATRFRKTWFRFSLLHLLVLITLIGVGFGWYHRVRQRADLQRATVVELEQYATVFYDYQLTGYENYSRGMVYTRWEPQPRMRDYLGVDFCHNVELVDFFTPLSQDASRALQELPGLKVIHLKFSIRSQPAWDELMKCSSVEKINSSLYSPLFNQPIDFKNLTQLNHLQELSLSDGWVTSQNMTDILANQNLVTLRLINVELDSETLLNFSGSTSVRDFFWKPRTHVAEPEEFLFIERLPNLERLATTSCHQLTESVFASLAKLTRLREISLHGSHVAGVEIGRLKKLPKLTKLELAASELNDEALESISQFSQLQHLEIGSTKVTDAGMPWIAKLENLRHLSIRDTAVSDKGLKHLKSGLPNLRLLRIRDTKISDSAIEDFRTSHPDCLIDPS